MLSNINNKKIIKSNQKSNIFTKIILFSGFLFRIIIGLTSNPYVMQHDTMIKNGHFDYAVYIFNNWKLAPTNVYEFSQPPINAILQALWMKINSLIFLKSRLIPYYTSYKYVNIIISIITLYIIFKILQEFDINIIVKNVILLIMAIYPNVLIMTTQYSNDNLSYLFFYLSLYLAIKWSKNQNIKTIILLALSIGIGMLTKISVATVSFIIGPMMFIIWIKSLIDKKKKSKLTENITFQIIIFALIVFPIGLSYSIRNLILFNQGFGQIYEIAKNTKLDMSRYDWTFADRFLSIPLNRFYDPVNLIYHDFIEYNIWVDLIKTAAFDEFNYGHNIYYIFYLIIYILIITIFVLSFISVIYNIYILIHYKNKKYSDNLLNIRILSIILYFIAIISYFFFNFKYQYSCNSNFRYISYLSFSQAILVSLLFYKNNNTIQHQEHSHQ